MTLEELVQTVFDDIWEKDNGEVYVDCIFCDDQKHRLGINVNTGVMHCFNCEERCGDKESVTNSKRKTYVKIADNAGITEKYTVEKTDKLIDKKAKHKKKYQTELPKAYEPLWKEVNDREGRRALRYTFSRGVTKEQIKHHRIGFCITGRYAFRIIFPIYYAKSLHGFVARDFTGSSELKYLNSDGEKDIYNLRRVRRRKDKAILVEGVFDVLAVERAKLKKYDVIGGLGSKLKPSQYRLLSTYNKIVVWAEPDDAGVKGTIKRAQALQKEGVKIYVVIPDQDPELDTDPGAMDEKEIIERIRGALPYTDGVAKVMRTRIAFSSKRQLKKGKYVKRNGDDA